MPDVEGLEHVEIPETIPAIPPRNSPVDNGDGDDSALWTTAKSHQRRRFTWLAILVGLAVIVLAIVLPWQLVWAKNDSSNNASASASKSANEDTATTTTNGNTNSTANSQGGNTNSTQPTTSSTTKMSPTVAPLASTTTARPSTAAPSIGSTTAMTDTPLITLVPTVTTSAGLTSSPTVTATTLAPTMPVVEVIPEQPPPTGAPIVAVTVAPVNAAPVAVVRTAFPTVARPPSDLVLFAPVATGPMAAPAIVYTLVPTLTMTPTYGDIGTVAPTLSARLYASSSDIRTTLQAVLPTAMATALSDTTTVSYQSLELVSASTNAYVTTTPLTSAQLVQHYSMTALALSSIGTNVLGALGVASECTWRGVSCNERNQVTHVRWGNLAKDRANRRVPDEVGLLSRLRLLDLAENDLIGTLPVSLYSLRRLRFLYLHRNKLSGPLSDAGWAKMPALERLYLGDNRFTGTLPPGLGSPGVTNADARALST
jgi:Leucine rich repeat